MKMKETWRFGSAFWIAPLFCKSDRVWICFNKVL